MNLEHLGEYLHLVESGSFTQAAQDLHLTQSTLSKHIAALENYFDAELLVRSKDGVHTTAAGEALAARAAQILQLSAQAKSEVRAAGTRASERSITAPEPAAQAKLRAAINQLFDQGKLDQAQTETLLLYLEGNTLDELAAQQGRTRDSVAQDVAAAYEALKVRNKQEALEALCR